MRLHRRSGKADWEKVQPARRNRWQQLAATTHGIVTPANFISVAGLLLVVYGSWLLWQQAYVAGVSVAFVGRLADILDGYVAERTQTKGPVGETMDAAIDKLALAVLVPPVLSQHLVPLLVIVLVILQNIINIVIATVGKAKKIELRPTAHGKIATAFIWLCLGAFIVLTVASRNGWQAWQIALSGIAYSSTVLFVIFGFLASQDYYRLAFESIRYNPEHDLLRKLNRIIIVINPQSSNVYRIEKRSQELSRLFPDKTITIVETTREPSSLVAKLEKELKTSAGLTVIGIGGGDGTVNSVVNALMKLSKRINLAETPVLPLWGGNANDFAHMLNGLSSRSTLRSLLGNGEIVTIHPLEVTMHSQGQAKKTRYAACYASFGASAYAAAELEKSSPELQPSVKSTLIKVSHEVIQALRAVLEAPSFDAEQDGKKIKIFEHMFSNGSRIAKVDHLPVKLHEKKFYRLVKSQKQPSLWFYIKWNLTGKRDGEITDRTSEFTLKERAWAQFDGEATIVPKNTNVSVGHADRPFYAITTKLKSTKS